MSSDSAGSSIDAAAAPDASANTANGAASDSAADAAEASDSAPPDAVVPCVAGAARCLGAQPQQCVAGTWQTELFGVCVGEGDAGGCASGSCTCSAPIAPDALPTETNSIGTGGYESVLGGCGYTYAYVTDATGCPSPSTICVDGPAACVAGVTGVQAPAVCSGVGLGFTMGGRAASGYSVPAASVGITYSLSSLAAQEMFMQVTTASSGAENPYCVVMSAASGTVPWGSLRQTCYATPPGRALTGPPTDLAAIQFAINDGATAQPFAFCVNLLSF